MWWEYLIIFVCLIFSIYLIVRYFYKNLSRNKCDNGCDSCTQRCDLKKLDNNPPYWDGRKVIHGQNKS